MKMKVKTKEPWEKVTVHRNGEVRLDGRFIGNLRRGEGWWLADTINGCPTPSVTLTDRSAAIQHLVDAYYRHRGF